MPIGDWIARIYWPPSRAACVAWAAGQIEGSSRFSDRRLAATAAYVDLAKRYGLDPAAMALAFARQKPFTTSVLMAASSASQLEHNLKSLDLTLSKEVLKEIDTLHDESPNPR